MATITLSLYSAYDNNYHMLQPDRGKSVKQPTRTQVGKGRQRPNRNRQKRKKKAERKGIGWEEKKRWEGVKRAESEEEKLEKAWSYVIADSERVVWQAHQELVY